MTLQYLFGPVSRAFAEQKLHGPRKAGVCLTFHPDQGEGDVLLRPEDSWQDLRDRLPADWSPDLLVLWLPYTTIPQALWTAPLPRLGLAPDWNLLWSYYVRRLPACDWAVTDRLGAELLNRAGLAHVRPGILAGCDRDFVEAPWPKQQKRDIDILIVGNFNPAVQRERMPWLGRIARLNDGCWKVVMRTGVFGESYRRLLARSRIVVQCSNRRKVGPRSFEAACAGALVFQEAENRELPAFFRDRKECVYYRPDNVEDLLFYYLTHEEERAELADAARGLASRCRFEDFWEGILGSIAPEVPAARQRPAAGTAAPQAELAARCWQALQSGHFDDAELIGKLEKAVETADDSPLTPNPSPPRGEGSKSPLTPNPSPPRGEGRIAELHNALGVMLGRQAQGRGTAQTAAEMAVEQFRRALARRPGHVLAGLNLAEALAAAGQQLAAVEAARRTLEVLQRQPSGQPAEGLDGLSWGRNFDVFAVELERAGWSNAGQAAAEAAAKQCLVRWRLHSLLAQWTDDSAHAYEAVMLRPDLAASRAALGTALLKANRPADAVAHLRQAVADNPLDRAAARACFHALGQLGDAAGQKALAEEQQRLSRACAPLLPSETWFAPPRLKGDELASIVILCCNQLDYTRGCLESLMRHTRRPYELILVDNASTDDTPEYLEEVRRRCPGETIIIRNETNRGFPAGCNQGLERARGRYVVFLNNDTVLTPGWLEGLIAASLEDWPNVGLVGPVSNGAPDAQGIRPEYERLEDLDAFAARRRKDFAGKRQAVTRLTGFCLLVRRDALDRIGRLDESFGIGFFEDDDLCVRAREAGFRLAVAQDVYVHHFGNRTFQQLGLDVRRRLEENFEIFRSKWGPEYTAGYRLPSQAAPAARNDKQAAAAEAPAALPAEPASWKDTGVPHSLCMIVRNEEHHLPDCLKSVQGLFPDIVIADTGSTDRTRQLAESFGARVIDFPWPDSFGASRNESLRHARGKWILWLDADDRAGALEAIAGERLALVMRGRIGTMTPCPRLREEGRCRSRSSPPWSPPWRPSPIRDGSARTCAISWWTSW